MGCSSGRCYSSSWVVDTTEVVHGEPGLTLIWEYCTCCASFSLAGERCGAFSAIACLPPVRWASETFIYCSAKYFGSASMTRVSSRSTQQLTQPRLSLSR